jgi:hypothetical protein
MRQEAAALRDFNPGGVGLGSWPKNGITAAAANPEILPLEFLLGDDPVHGSLSGWIAEW